MIDTRPYVRILLGLLLVTTACQEGADEGHETHEPTPLLETQTPPTEVPAEYVAGQERFTAYCQQCHGDWARGTNQGPPLVHIIYEPNHHADISFLMAVQRGVTAHHWSFGNMPPVAGVTPEDVAQITAYVRWLQREAGIY